MSDNRGKIFGIGMPKTGTQSLTVALRILGFDGLDHRGRGNSLLGDFSFADAGAAVCGQCEWIYPRLDRRFPNSKFILTTRELPAWLLSVKTRLRRIAEKQERPRVHLGWTAATGISCYDELLLTMAFERHEREVKRYFAGRADLLIFRVADGWPQLCGFLDRPVPQVAFPHVNKSRR